MQSEKVVANVLLYYLNKTDFNFNDKVKLFQGHYILN